MKTYSFRIPAKPKNINEIRVEDKRVSAVGMVVEKRDSELVIDDGTGQATVVFDNPSLLENVEVKSIVRVFGTPMEAQGGMEIHADVLQRMDGIDLKLYRKAKEELKDLEKEIGED